jgi:hypothetical protein
MEGKRRIVGPGSVQVQIIASCQRIAMSRTLNADLHRNLAGHLTRDKQGKIGFIYTAEWVGRRDGSIAATGRGQ